MGERIGTEQVKKEKGFIYYVGKDGAVWEAKMQHIQTNRDARGRITTETVKKENGFLYYVDKEGYVCRAPLSRGGHADKSL